MELLVKILSFAVVLCCMNACFLCVVWYWRTMSVYIACYCIYMLAPLFSVAFDVVPVIGLASLGCLRDHTHRALLARCIEYYIAPNDDAHGAWLTINRCC